MGWEDMAAKLHRENQELRSLVQWLDGRLVVIWRHGIEQGDLCLSLQTDLDRQQLAKKLDALNTHTQRGT